MKTYQVKCNSWAENFGFVSVTSQAKCSLKRHATNWWWKNMLSSEVNQRWIWWHSLFLSLWYGTRVYLPTDFTCPFVKFEFIIRGSRKSKWTCLNGYDLAFLLLGRHGCFLYSLGFSCCWIWAPLWLRWHHKHLCTSNTLIEINRRIILLASTLTSLCSHLHFSCVTFHSLTF
jgi:hypothetical protein